MESRSILGIGLLKPCRRRLKVALDRQCEDRPNELVVLLDVGDGRTVAEPLPYRPIEQVTAVDHIIHREADGGPEDVLVLDVEAGDPWQILAAVDLGQIEIWRVVAVLGIGAPRELGAGNVMPEL